MLELKKSEVVFHEEGHFYELNGRRLSGITSLIHEVLHLGIYPDASDFVKNVAIPRAAEYGTSVHKAIEFFDVTGMRKTTYPGKYGEWDVSRELNNYILHKVGYESVANEYTVSTDLYASQIDNVWQKISTMGIWLVDTKTNNVDYYPGGVDALKEYLSWQLSCYAYMFERQNPDLKVEGLACNWLRHENGEFWLIERKSDEEVEKLLDTQYAVDENGDIIFYYNEHFMSKPEEKKDQLMTAEAVQFLANVLNKQEELENIVADLKEKLKTAMIASGVKSWDAGVFKVTYTPGTTSVQFDSTRFKKENPDVAEQYQKTVTKSDSIRITLRKEKS